MKVSGRVIHGDQDEVFDSESGDWVIEGFVLIVPLVGKVLVAIVH